MLAHAEPAPVHHAADLGVGDPLGEGGCVPVGALVVERGRVQRCPSAVPYPGTGRGVANARVDKRHIPAYEPGTVRHCHLPGEFVRGQQMVGARFPEPGNLV